MPYVSAHYAPPPPPEMLGLGTKEGEPKQVIAIDDQGVKWSLREDSEVGDWLRYLENGGTIDPAPEGTS